MNNDNSSKQILLSVLGVAILVVAVVGVSFAAFTFSQAGETENTITTGTVTLTYTEGGDGISITDAMPTSESTGKTSTKETDYFDFTVAAEIAGTTTINYAISAEKVTSGENQTTLGNNDVRLYLEEITAIGASGTTKTAIMDNAKNFTPAQGADDTTGRPADEMELYKSSFSSTDTKYYRLRMWLDENYGSSDTTGESFAEAKKFTVKVNVYAKADQAA